MFGRAIIENIVKDTATTHKCFALLRIVLPMLVNALGNDHLRWIHAPLPSGRNGILVVAPTKDALVGASEGGCGLADKHACECTGVRVYMSTRVRVYVCTCARVHVCTCVHVYDCTGVRVYG